MGYIYKITNLVNNKAYIGQTTWPVETRWASHINVAVGNNKTKRDAIHLAIAKYGVDNFSFEVIETPSDDKLNEREQYWIDYYHTYIHEVNSQGYNMTRGGEGTLHIDVKEILHLWEEGYTEGEIVSLLGCTDITCSSHLHEHGISTEEIKQRAQEKRAKACWKVLYQYDLQGHLIKIWPSLTSVAEYGYNKTNISNYIHGKGHNAYNSLWTYNPDELPELLQRYEQRKFTRKQKVGQYDLQNNLIHIWESAAEAGRNTPADESAIRNCCKGKPKYKTAGGFIWKYIKEEDLNKETMYNDN